MRLIQIIKLYLNNFSREWEFLDVVFTTNTTNINVSQISEEENINNNSKYHNVVSIQIIIPGEPVNNIVHSIKVHIKHQHFLNKIIFDTFAQQ